MKRKAFSPAEIAKVHDLRKKGMKWIDIAEEVGRTASTLHGKFSGKNGVKPPKVAKPRKYIKARMPDAPAITRERPMIALVGNPLEVTNTLRELFS